MDRLETSNAKLSLTWPKAEQYRHYRPGQAIGAPLPDEDMENCWRFARVRPLMR